MKISKQINKRLQDIRTRWEYIAPMKDFNKDKRKEQIDNHILIWGGVSSVELLFFT